MKIYIRMFGRFKHQFWETKCLDFPEPVSPLHALKEAISLNLGGYTAFFDEKDRIRNHIVLMVNKKRIQHADAGSILLKDSDELAVLPPVAGG
ncbi:MAG: ThiS family protein [Methanoregulaceae archaeon PtaB.Bin152]|nr:MAG: ThiS family protein [Methanoregulaceae archaeon PtaB.Bin152]